MARLFITPHLISGIYQIRNTSNGKVYIGSAVNLKRRKSQHFHCLRKGNHPNCYLQNAFNKGQKLKFFVIEYCDESALITCEQSYIDILWDNGERCYNVAREAGRFTSALKTYDVVLQDPSGNLHGPIVGLGIFARKHGLHKEHLSALLKGRLKTCNGWKVLDGKTKRPQSQSKSFAFVSPDGNTYKNIANVTEFAESHGLNRSSLSSVATGKRASLFGWKLLKEHSSSHASS